jgi:beta-fructofuranosidase
VNRLRTGFVPRLGWVNDPHGTTFHDGVYHLFFQHLPDSRAWRPEVCWGHATSPDLQTWTEHAPVLTPDEDDRGCWSGCLVESTIFYTSVSGADLDLGVVRSAVPVDGAWTRWHKTTFRLTAPQGLAAFRDPSVVAQPDGWRMVVGARSDADRPVVVSFASDDLVSWRYDGVLAKGDPDRDGDTWECPQLVQVDGAWVLVVSRQLRGEGLDIACSVGTLDGGRFDAGPWHLLTTGSPYAGSVFRDEHDRPTMMFWLREEAALSAPYLLARDGDRLTLVEWPRQARPAGG